MKKNKLKYVGLLLGVFLIIPGVSLALEIKEKRDIATISKDRVINDDVLISGRTVTIDGTINGDLKAAGADVTINGNVNGDVMAAGSTVTIKGKIADDLIAVGGTITVKGEVADDLMVAGGTVILEGEVKDNVLVGGGMLNFTGGAKIGRDLLIGGGVVILAGEVMRDVTCDVGEMTISGKIGGNLNAQVDEKLVLGPNAEIGGDLKYKARHEAKIEEGAKIIGKTVWTPIEKVTKKKPTVAVVSKIISKIFFSLAFVALAIVVVLLFPKKSLQLAQTIDSKPGKSFGYGLLVFLLTPAVILVLFLTLIGIPLALIMLALYFVALCLSKIFVGLWIGRKLLKSSSEKEEKVVWPTILGNAILVILMAIPFVGFLAKILALLFGLGAMTVCTVEYCVKKKIEKVKVATK